MPPILPLLLFVGAATITPGGATALATASGASFGFARSIPLLTGIAVGLAAVAAVAALGLGQLLVTIPALQFVAKALGSAYLLWLAWRVMHNAAPVNDISERQPATLSNGLVLLALNPKSWAVTIAAAASFETAAGSPAALALLLSMAFGVAACISLAVWCAIGVALARFVRTEHQWRIFNAMLGALLVASVVLTWI